ncbi:MAG TPA: hypothetical protein VGX37_12720 [Allosphingosinicella sp.]|jgi:hypothetical protein|nr:hypothetical protein [Allosphingosinicella sp.]
MNYFPMITLVLILVFFAVGAALLPEIRERLRGLRGRAADERHVIKPTEGDRTPPPRPNLVREPSEAEEQPPQSGDAGGPGGAAGP